MNIKTTTFAALVAGVLIPGFPAVHGEEGDWDINNSMAPETNTLNYVATEGTWMNIDVSPDGRHIAFDLLGHVYEMDVAGGEARPLTDGRSWNGFPRYSPDGNSLLITSDRGGSEDAWLLERESGLFKNISNMPDGVTGATWSADGRHVFAQTMHDGTKNKAYRFSLYGSKQALLPEPPDNATRPGAGFRPLNHFREDGSRDRIYFEILDSTLPAGGSAIKYLDTNTGQVHDYIRRTGGAVSPALSGDNRYLAYVHRNDQATELILHDLETREEKVLLSNLDRDRQDYFVYHHPPYPAMAWLADNRQVVFWSQGKIQKVDIHSGQVSEIPFAAQVDRELDKTIRFRYEFPGSEAKTRVHRWAQQTPDGILYETLGDLYLQKDHQFRQVTTTPGHETSPLHDANSAYLYYAYWTDDERGSIYRQKAGKKARELIAGPSQFGSLALSPDGQTLAFVRGDRALMDGTRIEFQTSFELVTMPAGGGKDKVVTEISWQNAGFGVQPVAVQFSPDGQQLYFTAMDGGALVLNRVDLDGNNRKTLYRFPNAARADISPDARWILYQEYHRSYLTPFDYLGTTITVSAEDSQGASQRIDAASDGYYHRFTADSEAVEWTRGTEYQRKSIDEIYSPEGQATASDIAVSYVPENPQSVVALTNARIITVNADRDVLQEATLLVEGNRIVALGADVAIPDGAKVFDLEGKTLMPGIIDAHAHYMSMISPLHVIEQRVATLRAALAHGVTTMYEVYGTLLKDVWLSDMLRAGKTTGPRLFTVGTPMYGVRSFRPKTYRAFKTNEDVLEQVRFNKAHGASALKDYITLNRRIRHQLAVAARAEGLNLVIEPGGEGHTNLTRIVDGATGIAHGMGFTSIYEDYLQFFGASELGITPTLLVTLDSPMGENWYHQHNRVWENEKLNRFARQEELIARFRRPQHVFDDDYFHPQLAANMKKFYDHGVSIQLGGHGQLLGLDAHLEMIFFSSGGFSNMEVLEIATLNGARHQGLDHELGSLEAGKLADLIVLSGNPLEDIQETQKIDMVMKNGVLYSGEDAGRIHPDPEPAGEFYFKK